MNILTDTIFNSKRILKNTPLNGELPNDADILKRTLKIAWPSMLESFLIAMVSLMDTLMVSGVGDYAVSAVSLTIQPQMVFFAAFFALSAAVSALVARRRGEGDREGAVRVIKMALVVTVILDVVVVVITSLFADDIIRLVGSQPDTHEYAVQYFKIIIPGIVFNVTSMVINSAQKGSGNTKIAMKTNLTSNGINVIFNYLLIGGNLGFPALGVAGAAIATDIGVFVAIIMSIISICQRDGYIYIGLKTGKMFDKRSAKSLLSIGSSTFLEQIFLRIGFLSYAIIIANLGTTMLTTHQICNNMMQISFSFGDGLSTASVALVGFSLGENRPDLAKVYGSFCQRCGLICSAVLSIIYVIFGKRLVMLFSDTPEVISNGAILMNMLTIIVFFQISQVIFSGCLRGSGDVKFVAMVSFVNVALLRPVLAYVMCYTLGFGLIGAWSGLIIDQFVRLLMTALRFKGGKWMKISI